MNSERSYWVYILASRLGGTLYIGVTSDLIRRVYEHRSKAVPGFTKKYGVSRLVYYEQFGDVEFAIQREKRLKKWPRTWKIRLIEAVNPDWHDLYPGIAGPEVTGSHRNSGVPELRIIKSQVGNIRLAPSRAMTRRVQSRKNSTISRTNSFGAVLIDIWPWPSRTVIVLPGRIDTHRSLHARTSEQMP